MTDFGHAIGIPAPSGGDPDATPPPPPYGHPPAYGPAEPLPAAAPDLDLESAHARARSRAESGDLTGARTMLEEALAAGELRRGAADPALVPLMVDVATLARRLGNLTEAANQLRRAYGIAAAASGPQHPTVLSIEGRLAAVLYRLGESTEAYDWHLADAGRRVLGDGHPAVRGAKQRLAALAQAPNPLRPEPPEAAAWTPPEPAAWTPPTESAWTPPPESAWTSQPAPDEPPEHPAGLPAPVASPPVPAASPPVPAAEIYGPAIEGDVWEAGEATVRTRRLNGGGVVLVASLGAVVLVVAVVVALALFAPPADQPAAQQPGTRQSPVMVTPTAPPTSPAPDAVRIVDDGGGTVTLAWSDPSSGAVPFLVSGARQGHALVAIQPVPAGETTVTIYGLNVNFNYCFTVAAVWSADMIRESVPTCTRRSGASSPPAG